MRKTISILFLLSLAFSLMLSGSLPAQTVMAQAEEPSPDTPVSSDGILAPDAEIGGRDQAPFEGSGVLSPTMKSLEREQYPGSVLQPLFAENPSSVIGSDGRTRIRTTTAYPYRAIVFLEIWFPSGASGTCSGWYYAARTVATAGHCVYSASDGGWATLIKVWPGRSRGTKPYGFTTNYRLFSVSGWTSGENPDYDYGAIQTNAALGSTVGWFGYRWQASDVFPGVFTVTGYPGDKAYATMWSMNGLMMGATTYHLWYDIDTFGGQSGSPFYQVYNGACCYGVGIHTYGVGLGAPPLDIYNSATRITMQVYRNMNRWKKTVYP